MKLVDPLNLLSVVQLQVLMLHPDDWEVFGLWQMNRRVMSLLSLCRAQKGLPGL